VDVATLRTKYVALAPMLTERARRCRAAAEARAVWHGGIARVMRATGISWSTIQRGVPELDTTAVAVPLTRIRRSGGGRKALTAIDVTLLDDLDALVEPDAWRSRVAPALALPEYADAGLCAASAGPSGESHGDAVRVTAASLQAGPLLAILNR
jgi:hypothetical protein